jgi:hypothetical protein
LRRGLGLVLLFALNAVAGAGWADCPIKGSVKANGLPLAGVEISAVRGTAAPVMLGLTGNDGSFSLTVEELDRGLQVLELQFRKPPFEPQGRLLSKQPAGKCPTDAAVNVAFGASAAPATNEDVCATPSVTGLTIFVAPFQFYGGSSSGLDLQLNAGLPDILYRRILAFQSRLGAAARDDISVSSICLPLSAADGEHIRQIGHRLNALGVVAGEGETGLAATGETFVDLSSTFRIIPAYGDHGGMPLPIVDKILAVSLRPSRLADQLQDLWGKQAVFASALRRLGQLPEPHDPTELERIHRLLIEVRKTMTDSDLMLGSVQALIDAIEVELSR